MDCPHGMPSAASCITCMEDGPVAPPPSIAEPDRASRPFVAHFDGECHACGQFIHAGITVIRVVGSDGRGMRAVCDGCEP